MTMSSVGGTDREGRKAIQSQSSSHKGQMSPSSESDDAHQEAQRGPSPPRGPGRREGSSMCPGKSPVLVKA